MSARLRRLWPVVGLSAVLLVGWMCGLTRDGMVSSAQAKEPRVARTGFSRVASTPGAPAQIPAEPFPVPEALREIELSQQTAEEARAKSWGCIACHEGAHDPHAKGTVRLGCTDCHGGNANCDKKEQAHVNPVFYNAWTSSANPVRSYTLLNQESPAFIQFVNPGDLRVAHLSCGLSGCHPGETLAVKKSMMTHGCMLWGSALYNNGAVPDKHARYGESYSMFGTPQRLQTVPCTA